MESKSDNCIRTIKRKKKKIVAGWVRQPCTGYLGIPLVGHHVVLGVDLIRGECR